jgi:hypothetical protein
VIGGHLSDIGVLAKLAAKVAANRRNGVRKGAGQKMKQGFFFDGINVPGNEFAVNQCLQDTARIFTNAANSPTTVFDHTAMTAKVALDLVVLKGFIKVGFHGRFAPI